MNIHMILSVTLLLVVFASLLNSGYLTYVVTVASPAKTGADIKVAYAWMFYAGIGLQVVALVVGGASQVLRR